MAMMGMTTSNSISVNADRARDETEYMGHPWRMITRRRGGRRGRAVTFPRRGPARHTGRAGGTARGRSLPPVGQPAERLVDLPHERPVQLVVHRGELHLPLRAEPPAD